MADTAGTTVSKARIEGSVNAMQKHDSLASEEGDADGHGEGEGASDYMDEVEDRGDSRNNTDEPPPASSPPRGASPKLSRSITQHADGYDSKGPKPSEIPDDDQEQQKYDAIDAVSDDDRGGSYASEGPRSSDGYPDQRPPSSSTSEPKSVRVDPAANRQYDDEGVELDSESVTDADPEAPLRVFDWSGLYERFEAEMKVKDDEEAELQRQWANLMNACLALKIHVSSIIFGTLD
ncbi:MAG: hypothetical protein M1828_005348 [Chrysothrix sp. TS-e1954]|nr:MAG: hypothetical protein M1828_005348 [Chrysothrix sp. TS-e1954]